MTKTLASALYALALTLSGCADDPAAPADMKIPPDEEQLPEQPPQPPAAQKAGELDRDFGTNGIKSLTPELGPNYYASVLLAQGDKLLACVNEITSGGPVAHVVRFTTDGAIDPTFASNGDLTIMPANATQTSCIAMTIQPNGFHVVVQLDSYPRLHAYKADGEYNGSMSVEQGAAPAASAGSLYGINVSVYGVNKGDHPQVQAATAGSSWGFGTVDPYPGTTVRAFSTDSSIIIAGSYQFYGQPAVWSTFKKPKDTYQLVPTYYFATRGTDEADLMHDAVQLSDGTVFAVGGVDLDVEVMAAHFVGALNTVVTVENHANGGASTGKAIALDSMERPVVVGSATVDGKRAFGWQRYQANSSKLDTTFGAEGIASVAAPVGEGELVDAVHIGDRTFAIGNSENADGAYEVALVRIVE